MRRDSEAAPQRPARAADPRPGDAPEPLPERLSSLLHDADPAAEMPQRHLWLVRLFDWLRAGGAVVGTPADRLLLLLDTLEGDPAASARVRGCLREFRQGVDAAALFADFGFGPRMALRSELWQRLRSRWLPATPDTRDLAALFPLIVHGDDEPWIEALPEPTLARVARLLFSAEESSGWQVVLLDAMTYLVTAVRAAGFSSALRQRMDRSLLADEPFKQLAAAAERLRLAVLERITPPTLAPPTGDPDETTRRVVQEALYLRTLLGACQVAADSVAEHLEAYGVSVDIVYEVDQLHARCVRIEQLLLTLLSDAPAQEWQRLVAALAQTDKERQGIGRLLARHYSQLARQVAERSAETGEHYITRSRAEYRDMLARAAGGGALMCITTFAKFGLMALGLSLFWGGFWAGVVYAATFMAIMLLHWTVATKQPAMTAPAMAAKLAAIRDPAPGASAADAASPDAAVEGFVDEVANLIRSQAAGIFGNVALVAPLVLAVQAAAAWASGAPLVGVQDAEHVLHSLTLLGPTALYAAFTGVLLFASSLIAGWTENWFVFHRLDSALALNPRIVATLGPARAVRWASWWRANISGVAANVSLGFMLGIVPVLLLFFGLPLDVRHVTLSTGQLAAAAGALGVDVLREPEFWWCVAGIVVIGMLNLGVSFWLAFKVALASRGVRMRDRARIRHAVLARVRRAPLSFVWPPRG